MWKRLLLIGMFCTPAAAWAFLKPIRIVAPELAGLSCVTDTVCTDDVSRYREAAELYEKALSFVDSSLGSIENKPRAIFCKTATCFQSFGFAKQAGVTIGTLGIVIGPRAWKAHYVRHEIIHHLQNEKLGIFAAWLEPRWLIEGMAYALSADPRPTLTKPFEDYRAQFADWYARVGKERLWAEAASL